MSERNEGRARPDPGGLSPGAVDDEHVPVPEEDHAGPPALHTAVTARGLARHRSRSLRWLVLGILVTAVCVVAAWWGAASGIEWLEGVGSRLAAAGVVILGLGASGLYANARMRQILAAGPWLTRRAHQFPPSRLKGVGVVLRDPHGGLCPLLVLSTRQRYQHAMTGPDGTLWWCPGPGGRGVLVRPDGHELLYARTPFTAWGRRTRIEDARRAGLDA
ncbi:hypothetical protein ABZ837_24790 [Streptomyces sp. NPDC047197]|uniref:hypothetical protein n=1 Tax=Streptomyces sp. NPDC047197 TaxID=3155477 RepID=UPI0033F73AC4